MIGIELDLFTSVDSGLINLASTIPVSDVLFAVQSDIGVTSSGGLISNWADQAAVPHDMTATLTRRPTLTAGVNGSPGILLDGVNNGLSSALLLPSPGTTPYRICLVFRQITWTAGGYVCGDLNGVSGVIYSSAVTPQLRQYNGGSPGPAIGSPALGTWEATEAYYTNSAADAFKRGSGAPQSLGATSGNATGSGWKLGNGVTFTVPANVEFVAAMVVTGASAIAMPAAWRLAVASKYGPSVAV